MLQYFMTSCTEQWTVLKLQCVNILTMQVLCNMKWYKIKYVF